MICVHFLEEDLSLTFCTLSRFVLMKAQQIKKRRAPAAFLEDENDGP